MVALRGIAKRNDIPIDKNLTISVEDQIKEVKKENPKITKAESQESIDKLIEVFDTETPPVVTKKGKKKVKQKYIAKKGVGVKPKPEPKN